jgi:threonine dehydratase
MNDGLREILLARVYEVATKSPLQKARKLSKTHQSSIYLKRKDLQSVHSFKLRGAYNKMVRLSEPERHKGVIAASAGNHAQGVALAAQKLKISTLIIMPRTTPAIKIEAVQSLGAETELFGDSYSEAYEYALKRAAETQRVFIHAYDDPLVIAGQGTIGLEILEQLPLVTHIFVPIGDGGLIAGIAQYVKALKPQVRIIGVEPEDSNAMQASLAAGKRVVLPHVGIFADGVAVKQVGRYTFSLAKKFVDECITVTNDQICAAIKAIFEETRSIVEPAGALGVAGITVYSATHDLKNAQVVSVCSGANMTFERLQFIAERTLLGSGNEALFSVVLKEGKGNLKQFCKEIVNGHHITELSYRARNRNKARIFIGINVSNPEDKGVFMRKMEHAGYAFNDLSTNETAKEHTRFMNGGPAPTIHDEHLYTVNFPERPGALADFLAVISPQWTVSLFHYRGLGGDTGNVLIGIEASNQDALDHQLDQAHYAWQEVTESVDIRTIV